MKTPSDINVLVLEGSPRERGRVHGETLKPLIWEAIERLKYRLRASYRVNPDKIIDQFVEKTGFIAAVKKWTPDLLEEVEGIGEGAGVDFNTIFWMQCTDEDWLIQELFEQHEHCSALGCFKEGDSPALLAQNMDYENFVQGLDVLLHIKHPDSSLESFVYTYAGKISLCGLNNKPVGVCCNALTPSLNHAKDGLPSAFILRSILEQPNLDKAIEIIHKIKHASDLNYMIGGAEKVVSFECSANKVCQYIPFEGARRVYHTNHPLANDDLIFPPKRSPEGLTSHARFDYLESRLKDPSKKKSPWKQSSIF